jgi:putative membrane-bound dehydrogenase-like protein
LLIIGRLFDADKQRLCSARNHCSVWNLSKVAIPAVVLLTPLVSCRAIAQTQSDAVSATALDVIESERGGRHWADLATDPPQSPHQSLASFQIEPGFRIELVASEPIVYDPVAIEFDHRGRMCVVEFSDYPVGPPDGADPLSKIVMLADSDGDGVMDRRHLFADKIEFVNSLMPYQDGLLVGAKTKLMFLRDTDGDHVADVRETLFDGFTPAHPQMQICNPRWGIDNWVYCNYGPGNVFSLQAPGQVKVLPGKDFLFNPRTMAFGSDSGLGQFGNTIDRWGNRFYCLNRNPIQTTFLAPSELARNPYHIPAHPFYDVGPAGGETRVYPLVSMKSNYLSHAGTHTAACGTTAYLGEFGDRDLQNSLFVCEPIGHLVTRSIIASDGLRLAATRARPQADFLASTDTWFRPASLTNGPDGALYLADMYRLWIEHPNFLPAEIAAKLDWRAGEDRGRIYRIVPADFRPRPYPTPHSSQDCVDMLGDPNGWRQYQGQRLLVENHDQQAMGWIRHMLAHPLPTARLHALWTLEGLDNLQPSDLITAARDPEPHVRIAAIHLAGRQIDSRDVFAAVAQAIADPDVRVRLEVALTLAKDESQRATELLCRLAASDGHDPMFADGLLTATANRSATVLRHLFSSATEVAGDDPSQLALIRNLATVVGARGDQEELAELLTLVVSDLMTNSEATKSDLWRMAAINGFGQGLTRYRGELGRLSLPTLIANPPATLAPLAAELKQRFGDFAAIAIDDHRAPAARALAIELLAFEPLPAVSATLTDLLRSDQPLVIQSAGLEVLSGNGTAAAAALVIDHWDQLRPALHATALAFLLRRPDSINLTLTAMENDTINPAALSIDQRVLLLSHADRAIKQRSSDLFGGGISADRRQVAKQYEAALAIAGTPHHGQQLFQRICATCHRKDGLGNDAGPDLSDLRNRSKLALLYDILDPNAKIDPQFTASTVLTADGRLFVGLLESESDEAIVLKLPAGQRQTIGRGEIESLKMSSVSLMPEGIEKDLTPTDMADLLAYLQGDG